MHKLSRATENLLRLAILVGFALLFYKVITKGELLQLIHPQFTANAKIGLSLFVLLIIVQMLRFFSDMGTHSTCQDHMFASCFYSIFIGALAIFLLIPAKPLGSITAEQKGIKYLGNSPSITASAAPDKFNISAHPYESKIQPQIQPAVQTESVPRPSSILSIDDTNYIRVITAMYEDATKFVNREVNLKGFVYRPSDLKPNQFMVVRFEISCCAADGVPSGLLVEWSDSSLFKNDSWVEVRGQIHQGSYEGIAVPLLIATKVASISPLPSPYVYTGNLVVTPDFQQNVQKTLPTKSPSSK